MRKISIISLTSSKDAYQDLVKEYQKIKTSHDLELIEFGFKFSSTNISEIKRKETLKVLKLLEEVRLIFLFFLKGVELDSVSFSSDI